MLSSILLGISLQALTTVALPLTGSSATQAANGQLPVATSTGYDWRRGYVSDFTIHASCNATERHELTEGLRQAVEMAEQAKNHILVHGNNSAIYRKYFGAQGATGTPIGWFEKVISGNKDGVIFRCDDPDRNCETQDSWAGHWRGANATAETVICPLSYQIRLPNTAMCARGFEIASGRPANFWGPDLLHRLYHVPIVGEGIVEHYADGYAGVQELAAGNNYTWAGSNSATLTYFAAEVYAYDIAIPGEGCVGNPVASADDGHGAASTSSSTVESATATATTAAAETSVNPTRVVSAEPTTTGAIDPSISPPGSECHTHDDGTLHCV